MEGCKWCAGEGNRGEKRWGGEKEEERGGGFLGVVGMLGGREACGLAQKAAWGKVAVNRERGGRGAKPAVVAIEGRESSLPK